MINGSMIKPLRLVLVAGARPNFMKIAPLIHCIERHNHSKTSPFRKVEYILVHTGQHYDTKMSDVFFQELGIPQPHVSLGVGSGSHAVQTAKTMLLFEPVCIEHRPDWVVVVGDVNSTVACALVAAKLRVRIAHVEAGLRSFDRSMPEEINRVVTDSIADLLLTPSDDGNRNLQNEGIPESKVALVGNIMIDSLVANLTQARASNILARLMVPSGGFAYVTLHRPANVDVKESLQPIMTEILELSRRLPVIFPIHPRTRKMLVDYGIDLSSEPGLQIIDPIGYHDSLSLTENARVVLTDSGGRQEESTYFRTPCLTLRDNTERPITITIGSNRLCGIKDLRSAIETVLREPARLGAVPPLWDGQSAGLILGELLKRT